MSSDDVIEEEARTQFMNMVDANGLDRSTGKAIWVPPVVPISERIEFANLPCLQRQVIEPSERVLIDRSFLLKLKDMSSFDEKNELLLKAGIKLPETVDANGLDRATEKTILDEELPGHASDLLMINLISEIDNLQHAVKWFRGTQRQRATGKAIGEHIESVNLRNATNPLLKQKGYYCMLDGDGGMINLPHAVKLPLETRRLDQERATGKAVFPIQGDHVDKVHVSFESADEPNIDVKLDIDESAFTNFLRESTSQCTQEGMKKIWVTLPSQFVNLRKVAEKEGFHLCDGSSGNHRLVYKIPQTNHNPEPNASHIMSCVEKRKRISFRSELYDVESGELKVRGADTPDNRGACYELVLKNKDGFKLYVLVTGLSAPLLQAFHQAADPTLQNKITLAAAFGSLIGNVGIAIFVCAYRLDKPVNRCISLFFNLSGTIPYYLAYSMLMPGRYSLIGVPIICIILTIWECYEKIQKMLKWSFEKCVSAVKCLGRCFWSSS